MYARHGIGTKRDDVVVNSAIVCFFELVEEKSNADCLPGLLVASLERLQDGAHVCPPGGAVPRPYSVSSRFFFFRFRFG
jgi:hypothetical protein